MPDAIALSIRELPARYQSHPAITARLWRRCEADEEEVVFRYRGKPSPPLLPVIYQDQFRIVRWGNPQRHSRHLLPTGTVHAKDLAKPAWKRLQPQDVIIQAQALLHRNVWITVIEGIRGVCVFDEHGIASAYMVIEPATDYYQIMTKSGVMPKLIGEII